MVVKTRSYYSKQAVAPDSISITAPIAGDRHRDRRRRCVKITTPSFYEASTRTYKLYSPNKNTYNTRGHQEHEQYNTDDEYVCDDEHEEAAAEAAAEALVTLQEEGCGVSFATHNMCLNPLNQIEKYIYRICVYDFDRTTHLKTTYILYDTKSRLYYVYSIIRELEHGNLLQLKYTSFVCEKITNYIMTLVIPSNPFDYYIQDDIIGVVTRGDDADRDFGNNIFGNESSFYDVEGLIYNTTPTTTSAYSAFMLMPSRHFWYSRYSSSDNMRCYTIHTLDSAMRILSQSH